MRTFISWLCGSLMANALPHPRHVVIFISTKQCQHSKQAKIHKASFSFLWPSWNISLLFLTLISRFWHSLSWQYVGRVSHNDMNPVGAQLTLEYLWLSGRGFKHGIQRSQIWLLMGPPNCFLCRVMTNTFLSSFNTYFLFKMYSEFFFSWL